MRGYASSGTPGVRADPAQWCPSTVSVLLAGNTAGSEPIQCSLLKPCPALAQQTLGSIQGDVLPAECGCQQNESVPEALQPVPSPLDEWSKAATLAPQLSSTDVLARSYLSAVNMTTPLTCWSVAVSWQAREHCCHWSKDGSRWHDTPSTES